MCTAIYRCWVTDKLAPYVYDIPPTHSPSNHPYEAFASSALMYRINITKYTHFVYIQQNLTHTHTHRHIHLTAKSLLSLNQSGCQDIIVRDDLCDDELYKLNHTHTYTLTKYIHISLVIYTRTHTK